MDRRNSVADALTTGPNHDMQVAGVKENKPFEIPEGWVVEVRPRGPFSASKQFDKYYHELKTGKVFRSIVAVKRYLNQEEEEVSQSKSSKRKTYGNHDLANVSPNKRFDYKGEISKQVELDLNLVRRGKQVVPSAAQHKVSSSLPDGWIGKDVPRSDRIIKQVELDLDLVRRGKQVVPSATQHKVSSSLPDGWIVNDVSGKDGVRTDRVELDLVRRGKQVVPSATQHKVSSSIPGWVSSATQHKVSSSIPGWLSSATQHNVSSSIPAGWIVNDVPGKDGVCNDRISKQVELDLVRRGKQVVSSAPQHKVSSSIPAGWIVNNVPGKDGVCSDRISKQVELDLVPKGKQVVPSATKHKVSSSIPDGWIVEDVPRKDGVRTDRYYIDPVTKFKFRSLPEVKRYLSNELYLYKKKNARDVSKPSTPPKGRKKKILSAETVDRNRTIFDIFHPPERVSWISGRLKEEGKWSPFVDESRIPDHVKELWKETFLFGMNTGSDKLHPNIPQLTVEAAKSP